MLGFLDSCPEQLNQPMTQKEIDLECWAHFFVPLFSLGSSFRGLKTKFNSKVSLSSSKVLQRAPGAFSASGSCTRPGCLAGCPASAVTRRRYGNRDTARWVWLAPASPLLGRGSSYSDCFGSQHPQTFFCCCLQIVYDYSSSQKDHCHHRLFHHDWRMVLRYKWKTLTSPTLFFTHTPWITGSYLEAGKVTKKVETGKNLSKVQSPWRIFLITRWNKMPRGGVLVFQPLQSCSLTKNS